MKMNKARVFAIVMYTALAIVLIITGCEMAGVR